MTPRRREHRSRARALLALLAPLVLAAAPAAQAEGPKKPPVSVPSDLAAVIALRGKPCDGIARYEKQAENDYLVTCKDGHRYRVYIAPDDRVVVEER